jgi:TonB family protein
MFTLLSQQSLSGTPGRAALYASCSIHICIVVALVWFSFFTVPTARFQLMTVQAGSPDPVRQPQPVYVYAPLRNSPRPPADRTKPALHLTETPHQTESKDSGGFTATAIPSEFLTLLATETGAGRDTVIPLSPTRTIPPLMLSELSLPPPEPPPEPPPGEPDVKPPLVVGGHIEPAQLIKQTIPMYPPLARTARVEGVVLLEGTVNVSGSIENIHVIDGHPFLIGEAVKAVKKWKYRPAILNGQPTPSPVTITVRFILKYPGE